MKPQIILIGISCKTCGRSVTTTRELQGFECGQCARQRMLKQRQLWVKALANMPCMAVVTNADRPYRRGAATALRICLGYHVYSIHGRSNAQGGAYNAINNGAVPRDPKRQRLLVALAGPHGAVLARARLIQLGQADRFKIWPKGAS